MRRAVETLLITYDWGEALVALNVCLKPLVDHLFTREVALGAERQGDHAGAQMPRALAEGGAWHGGGGSGVRADGRSAEPGRISARRRSANLF